MLVSLLLLLLLLRWDCSLLLLLLLLRLPLLLGWDCSLLLLLRLLRLVVVLLWRGSWSTHVVWHSTELCEGQGAGLARCREEGKVSAGWVYVVRERREGGLCGDTTCLPFGKWISRLFERHPAVARGRQERSARTHG